MSALKRLKSIFIGRSFEYPQRIEIIVVCVVYFGLTKVLKLQVVKMMNGESSMSMTRKYGNLVSLSGQHFRKWQMEVYMFLKSLKVVYVLNTPFEEVVYGEGLEYKGRRRRWEQDNDICRIHILHGMSNALFYEYERYDHASELWETLELRHIEITLFNVYHVCEFFKNEILDMNLDGNAAIMVNEDVSSKDTSQEQREEP